MKETSIICLQKQIADLTTEIHRKDEDLFMLGQLTSKNNSNTMKPITPEALLNDKFASEIDKQVSRIQGKIKKRVNE